jgi:hypothetical protein
MTGHLPLPTVPLVQDSHGLSRVIILKVAVVVVSGWVWDTGYLVSVWQVAKQALIWISTLWQEGPE